MNKEERIQVQLNQEEIQEIIYCYEKDIEYIEQLEQENNQLKEQRKELRSWLEEEINKGGSSVDIAIKIHSFSEVLDKLNELEG